jgi:hypothetical protein
MRRSALTVQRCVLLFLLGLLLLFSPLILLFQRPDTVFGIPVMYLYLLGTWAGLIAATAWLLHGDRD